MPAIRVLIAFYFFVNGDMRSEAATTLNMRPATVCDLYRNFEKIFATEEFLHAAEMNRAVAAAEVAEILSGVHVWDRQRFQVDETTWGGAKYGRGKPTHKGKTQWFQTIAQVVNVAGEWKIRDFAIFPVADRKKLTLFENIWSIVPLGSTVTSDMWRGYLGLDEYYNHEMVNHSVCFRTWDGVHTNHIESLHRRLKTQLSKMRTVLGSSEDRIVAVMAGAALYRAGRGVTVNTTTRLQRAFKVVRWMATEGVDIYIPSPMGNCTSLTEEADSTWRQVAPVTAGLVTARADSDEDKIRLKREMSQLIDQATNPIHMPLRHDGTPDTIFRMLPSAARARSSSVAPAIMRSSTPAPTQASATGGSTPGEKRGRGRPRKHPLPPAGGSAAAVAGGNTAAVAGGNAPVVETLPLTVTEWDNMDDEEYLEASNRLKAFKAYVAESEVNRFIMSGDRDYRLGFDNTEAAPPTAPSSTSWGLRNFLPSFNFGFARNAAAEEAEAESQ